MTSSLLTAKQCDFHMQGVSVCWDSKSLEFWINVKINCNDVNCEVIVINSTLLDEVHVQLKIQVRGYPLFGTMCLHHTRLLLIQLCVCHHTRLLLIQLCVCHSCTFFIFFVSSPVQVSQGIINSLLSGLLLIKFSSLGSIPGGAALCFFVWSGCQFFYLCRNWKKREFD